MWILFHDDYYTMAVFEHRKSFYLYEYDVAPPRVGTGESGTVMDLQGCVGNDFYPDHPLSPSMARGR